MKNDCRNSRLLHPTLDMYMFREFMIPLFVLVLAFVILFLIGDVFDDLEDFLKHETKLRVMLMYFMYKLPGNIRFILPISLLLASMYTLAMMGKNNEITAMRASGISLQRCCCSIYIVAFLVSLLNVWFNESAVPVSERRAEEIRESETNRTYIPDEHKMLQYRSPDEARAWFFKYFDLDGVQKNVILKKYRKDGSLDWDLKAKSAVHLPGKGWEFSECVLTHYEANGFPGMSQSHKTILKDSSDCPEKPSDVLNAAKPPEELNSMILFKLLRRTKNMSKRCRNIYETTLYSRLAFPWASLLAVFLGVPIAAKNRRGGVFVSIVISIGLIVIYYLSSNIFIVLGKRGFVHPAVAGLGPTAAFITYAWYGMMRTR